jgi:hypothetical protein
MAAQSAKDSEMKLVKCLVACVVANAGKTITTQVTPNKDSQNLLYTEAVRYAQSDRFNIDFSSELMKRVDFFHPYFQIGYIIQLRMHMWHLFSAVPLEPIFLR